MIRLANHNFSFDESVVPDFVESVSSHHFGKKIVFKDRYASGGYQLLEFQNGFYAYVSNYILNQDFELELSVNKEDYLALHINQIQAGAEFDILLNNQSVSYDDKVVTSIFLTGSKDSFVMKGSSGACVNRVKIMIPTSWLAAHVPFLTEASLNNYLQWDEERLFHDSIDPTYRAMINKVMNTEDNPFYLSITQNILGVITERFFSRLHTKLQKNQNGNEMRGRVA